MPPRVPDRLEVRHARVAAVSQQQAVRERGRFRNEWALGLAIRRDLHRPDVIRESAGGGVGFDRAIRWCGTDPETRRATTT